MDSREVLIQNYNMFQQTTRVTRKKKYHTGQITYGLCILKTYFTNDQGAALGFLANHVLVRCQIHAVSERSDKTSIGHLKARKGDRITRLMIQPQQNRSKSPKHTNEHTDKSAR